MDPRFLPDSMRLHNSAAALATARQHVVRSLSQLDGLEAQGARDAHHYASLVVLGLDDALKHILDAHNDACKRERVHQAHAILERLDDIPSDYATYGGSE